MPTSRHVGIYRENGPIYVDIGGMLNLWPEWLEIKSVDLSGPDMSGHVRLNWVWTPSRSLSEAITDTPCVEGVIPAYSDVPNMGIAGLQKCTLMGNWIVKKRHLFDELMQGMDDLKAHREGKLTLKTTEVIPAPELVVTAGEITALREKLGCSQPVFAAMLHTKSKTLKNWEQGRAEPNAQAKVLIKLVQKDHRTLDQLATLT